MQEGKGADKKFHRGFAPITLSMNCPAASVKCEGEGASVRCLGLSRGKGDEAAGKKEEKGTGVGMRANPCKGAADRGARERKERIGEAVGRLSEANGEGRAAAVGKRGRDRRRALGRAFVRASSARAPRAPSVRVRGADRLRAGGGD